MTYRYNPLTHKTEVIDIPTRPQEGEHMGDKPRSPFVLAFLVVLFIVLFVLVCSSLWYVRLF